MTFKNWLLRYTRRNSPLGDLARDVASDKDFPTTGNTVEVYRSYLSRYNACDGAVRTLDRAWRSYRAAQRSGRIPLTVETLPSPSEYVDRKPKTVWGNWTYYPGLRVLRHKTRRYEVDLDRMATAAAVLDWIFQVTGKKWASAQDASDLLEALRVLVKPQATLCSGAMSTRNVSA